MKANYEDKIPKQTSEVSLGNLYDVNKQLMEKESPITKEERKLAKNHLVTWLMNNFNQKYLMLLCHEIRDYTMFNLNKTSTTIALPIVTADQVAEDIFECMTNRGQLLAIDQTEENAWEIWIRNPEGCFAYYLFPYGEAVLEY